MSATAEKSKKSKKSAPKLVPDPIARDPEDGPSPVETQEISVIHVPLGDIVADDSPNRLERPGAETVHELAGSMATRGLQHPIGVTRFGMSDEYDSSTGKPWLRLVWGRRRLEAAKLLGWEKIPAVLRRITSEADLIADRATENAHRLQETPVDEALKVAEVLAIFEAQASLGPTAEPARGEQPNLPVPIAHAVEARKAAVKKAAEYFGKSEQWIRDRGFLSRLATNEQALVASGRLPLAHAREICKLADPKERQTLAIQAAARHVDNSASWEREYPMPIADLRELVSMQVLSLAQVPWDVAVPFAGKPSCLECPHNSANNPGLFDGGTKISADPKAAASRHGPRIGKEPKVGACTDRACFAVKSGTAKRALRTTANRLVKEAKELPVKERPKWDRPAALAKVTTVIPDYLPKSAVVSAAAEASKVKRSGKGSGSIEVAKHTPSRDPRLDAETKLEEELRSRARQTEPLIAARLAEVPGAWAMYHILREHKLVSSTENHKNPEKILQGSEFRQLVALVMSPSVEGMKRIEKGCGRQFALLDGWYDGPSGLAEALAVGLGIDVAGELGPCPKLEDFMPKATKIDPPASDVTKIKLTADVVSSLAAMGSSEKLTKDQAVIVNIGTDEYVVAGGVTQGQKILKMETVSATPMAKARGVVVRSYKQLIDAWDEGELGRGDHRGQKVSWKGKVYVLGDTYTWTPDKKGTYTATPKTFGLDPQDDDEAGREDEP